MMQLFMIRICIHSRLPFQFLLHIRLKFRPSSCFFFLLNLWREEGQSEGGFVGNHHFVRNPSILVKASKRRTNSEKIPRSSHSYFRSLVALTREQEDSTLISFPFQIQFYHSTSSKCTSTNSLYKCIDLCFSKLVSIGVLSVGGMFIYLLVSLTCDRQQEENYSAVQEEELQQHGKHHMLIRYVQKNTLNKNNDYKCIQLWFSQLVFGIGDVLCCRLSVGGMFVGLIKRFDVASLKLMV